MENSVDHMRASRGVPNNAVALDVVVNQFQDFFLNLNANF